MSQISVYDTNGKELEKLEIDFPAPKKDKSGKTYSCAIRVLLQNWRQGTVSCKGRSDVSLTNKKPWRQKGTGRARAGTARSPLWRGGGVTFGPQPRTRKLSVNRKQIKLVLNSIFNKFLENEKLYCLDFGLEKNKPSTSNAFKALKTMGISAKKVVLFIPFEDQMNFASFRNLPGVNILCFDQPNAFDLSNCDGLVFLKKDTKLFKDMVSTWN